MGCLAGWGRVVLIVVNTTSSTVAVAIIACGFLIKCFLGDIINDDIVETITKAAFALLIQNTPVPTSIDFGFFTDVIGVGLIVFGFLLLFVSISGCCAACFSFRWLLIAFSTLLGVLILAQVIFYSVILPKASLAHVSAKDSLVDDLKTEYNRHHINSFTISADIIFVAAECCGVKGPHDFAGNPNMGYGFNSSDPISSAVIPPSCCKGQYIRRLQFDCAKDFNKGHSQGCYEKLQDIIEDWYPWLIPTLIITFLVQVGEIGAAIMIYMDKEDNAIV